MTIELCDILAYVYNNREEGIEQGSFQILIKTCNSEKTKEVPRRRKKSE